MHNTDQIFTLGPIESSRFTSVLLLNEDKDEESLSQITNRLQLGILVI